MPYNRRNEQTARAGVAVIERLTQIWMNKGSSAAGHIHIGVILTEAYHSHNPWVSAQYIVTRMEVYSVDTIRRRLEEMVDAGIVQVTEIDAKKVYRAAGEAAEATIKAYQLRMVS